MKYIILFVSFLFISCSATGQSTSGTDGKRALTIVDFDQWKSISSATLSRDGNLLVYGLNPQEGDGDLILRNLETGSDTEFERGQRFSLNYDGSHLVYFIAVPHEEVRQARIDGDRPGDVFDDTLAVYTIQSGALEKFPEVASFKMPEKSGDWLAWLYDRDLESNDENGEDESETEEDSADANNQDEEEITKTENDLVVRNLRDGSEFVLHFVEEYHFSKHGERLLYRTEPADTLDAETGLYIRDLESGDEQRISSGLESYRAVTMDSSGTRVAFIAMKPDPEDENDENGEGENENGNNNNNDDDPDYYGLYLWTEGDDEAVLIADESSDRLADGWMITQNSEPEFSHDETRLFFGTAPEPMRRDTSVEEIDMADVDIWHWQDDRLQSQQLVQLDQDRNRTFRAVYHIEQDTFVQLEDESLRNINIPDRLDAQWGIGFENRHYLHLVQWKGFPAFTDIYRVDIENGERILFKERVKATPNFSPGGRYMLWYDYHTQDWFSLHIESGEYVNLTESLEVAFYNELHDAPSDPWPYGVDSWTEDDDRVLIRDRYDIWVFDPKGDAEPYMLTDGYGRENGVVLRAFNHIDEARFISTDEIYLNGMFDSDKSSAIYRTGISSSTPDRLWREDVRAFTPQKAAEGELWMMRKSTFQEFPDIYLTDSRFNRFERVTRANPQQDEFFWGDVELFHFNSLDGEKLEGLLYTPEDFDPDKKYPMIVYFYERTSDRLHWYRPPAPSASTITPAFYTSRGYVVAMPDIVYREGNPGRSAEDAVIGMTLHLLDKGFVDRDRIALQGQSWGGYQIAHIITRTDMFAAAMAGAPVSNMTSAYGGIRWASGLNRQFQYEKTQSRIGGTLWERPMHYIENSPLFFADRVSTPLLMMHNDADGAVPWYQGIEFFTALKRLDQPVWMLNYNNEAHNLRERVNRKDLSRRMQQFFDHYLMDAPMPVWMKYGIPAVEKGKHQGFDLVE